MTARANVFRLAAVLTAVTVLLDQASKFWIVYVLRLQDAPFGHVAFLGWLDFTYVENRGVSFGLFAGGVAPRVFFTVLALVVSVLVLRWCRTIDRRIAGIGAGLIAGGALGNAIDRAVYGYVIDFVDVSSIVVGGLNFPWKFNIADAAINVGIGFLFLDAFLPRGGHDRSEGKAGPGFSDSKTDPITTGNADDRSAP